MNKNLQLENPIETPMQIDEVREFEHMGSRVILRKDDTFSEINFIGGETLEKIEKIYFDQIGGTTAKLEKPFSVKGADGKFARVDNKGEIIKIVSNWQDIVTFRNDVLGVLHKENLISKEILSSF